MRIIRKLKTKFYGEDMRKYIWSVFVLALIFSAGYTYADDKPDTARTADKEDWSDFKSHDKHNHWNFNFYNVSNRFEKSKPTIEFLYGSTKPFYHEDVFSGDFKDVNNMEIRLGNTNINQIDTGGYIIDYEYEYFYLANVMSSGSSENTKDIRAEAWRFGFAKSNGYGYKFGEHSSVNLYNTTGLGWTKLNFKDTAKTRTDKEALDVFGDAFRFGSNYEAGVMVRVYDPLALNVSYERAVVFPRTLFLNWFLGFIIEKAASGILTEFTEKIGQSSAYAMPVVNFVLQNGLSYGMYKLREKYMNWPFNTAPPFVYDNFKVGVALMF
jgi:opacity protein-like surface antigen